MQFHDLEYRYTWAAKRLVKDEDLAGGYSLLYINVLTDMSGSISQKRN